MDGDLVKFARFLQKIMNFILTFCIGIETDKIHSVELVGEATRIPIGIKNITEVFKKEPSRTLNSTDCVSRGCALQAAMLSPNF
jgi:heat shock protein 4